MSSAEVAAQVVKELTDEEVSVLKSFSMLIPNYETIDEDMLASKGKMHIDRVRFALDRLNEKNLIARYKGGYVLLSCGLDAIVLKILAENDVLHGLGRAIGIGKEADVFEGICKDERLAIKFFRIGRISFRDVRKRSYDAHSWLMMNINAARQEFEILKMLYGEVRVPKPIINVKHVIVMQLLYGDRLINIRLEEPEKVLLSLLEEIRKVYNKGIISADLSEYNVLYDGNDVWLIDFPQAVRLDHPNALQLLRRDIKNILAYFERKYKIKYSLENALSYITSTA